MNNEQSYRQLVRRYLEGSATREEQEVFFHLVREGELDEYLQEAGPDQETEMPTPARTPIRMLPARTILGLTAAAIVILAIGAMWWNSGTTRPRPISEKTTAAVILRNDPKPGGAHAILTLANGERIELDSAQKGRLASQGDARVYKVNTGSISYQTDLNPAATTTAGPRDSSAVYYNSISTPAGGEYEVSLADGTHVWLNALSSLRFPSAFSGNSREVVLTGEAYFEVAKDKKRPFQVIANGLQVQVLGTAFDINAYPDEKTLKTTLVNGAVRLVKSGNSLLLRPGQEGQSGKDDRLVLEEHADVEKALAWKNGYFSFEGDDIRTIMRQISRWYGIEVRYEGTPTDEIFGGQIGRNLVLSEVLVGLNASNIHFRMDGNVLTILHH